METRSPIIRGHSTEVRIALTVNGRVLPVAQLGPDFIELRTPIDHPPTAGQIELSIDGFRKHWAVELPDADYASPVLPAATLFGDESSYPACQAEARRLRAAGADRLEVRAAALHAGQARGWTATAGEAAAPAPRDGKLLVLFGACRCIGWVAVDGGRPPAEVLPLVRHL